MDCPDCGKATKVERSTRTQATVRRRRFCDRHGQRRVFTTIEKFEVSDEPTVLKSDGKTVRFNRDNIRHGIRRAAPTKMRAEELDSLTEQITDRVLSEAARRNAPDEPIPTHMILEQALRVLKAADPVLHVRYALVALGRRDLGADIPGQDRFDGVEDFWRWLTNEYELAGDHAYDEHAALDARPALKEPEVVVKRSGRPQAFDRTKLEQSIAYVLKGRVEDKVRGGFATTIATATLEGLGGQSRVTSGQLAAEILRVLRRQGEWIAWLRVGSTARAFTSAADYAQDCKAWLLWPPSDTQESPLAGHD